MKLAVNNIVKETEEAITVCFKNGNLFKKMSYKSGQFMTLNIPINNKMYKRAYSFSSSPSLDKDLKVTIKRVKNGLVSNFIHDHLKIGDQIEVDKPTGSFLVDTQKSKDKNYVFFVGGSGITPIFSISRGLLAKAPKSKILLIYANKNFESIIFRKEIQRLQDKYADTFFVEHILEENLKLDANYHQGLVTEALIMTLSYKHKITLKEAFYMICGPSGYMDAVKNILNNCNVSPSKIKVELFKSPEVVCEDKDLVSAVKIEMNGDSYHMEVPNNKSILQAALINNIPMPYSCRSGMCSSCKASCVSGEIKMLEGHLLEQREVDEGKILTCVSYATSESVTLSI